MLLLLPAVALLACAPAPAQPKSAHRYLARAQQVLDAIAEAAPKIVPVPGGSAWRVIDRKPQWLSLDVGASSAYSSSLVIFTAVENGTTTTVIDSSSANEPSGQQVQGIYAALAQRFTEIP
ncbi:hypothetical protein E7T09_20965 [Deinococcus sp. KSM4-11]|uniref:hypothetical protein n=1 Tax=Deinococcus sp. KSM4-11 TaxID=2568654 RepID=UPI0010A36C07|nr:hypothetical protein [Deinococcus sp. KSM4-11]THF83984.1 hypothetical protein E7T09_20965 [Deinococcus sp. KSM4-11]